MERSDWLIWTTHVLPSYADDLDPLRSVQQRQGAGAAANPRSFFPPLIIDHSPTEKITLKSSHGQSASMRDEGPSGCDQAVLTVYWRSCCPSITGPGRDLALLVKNEMYHRRITCVLINSLHALLRASGL